MPRPGGDTWCDDRPRFRCYHGGMGSEHLHFNIQLVEDDDAIRDQVAARLGQWEYRVLVPEGFTAIDRAVAELSPHLVILDINLPVLDGFEWCRRIRAFSRVPVIMVSARDSGPDTVMGLSSGADDYLAKPFSAEVLVAKVRALLRRTYDYGTTEESRLVWHDLVVDLGHATACRGAQSRELTRNELLILGELVRAKGNVVSRDQLATCLWRDEIFVDENTLNVNVSRVRQVLGELDLGDSLRTIKGRGYQLT